MVLRRTIDREGIQVGPQKPVSISLDALNDLHSGLIDSLRNAGYLHRKSNYLTQMDAYTIGAISYVSSKEIPFREERLVVYRDVGKRNYLRIALRDVEHDPGLVDLVHQALDERSLPQNDIELGEGLTTYDFIAE